MPMRFDEELARLKQDLLRMSGLAERMIRKMDQVLVERKTALIAEIRADETTLDQFQVELDNHTIRLISVYTPVAGDLRLLIMISRIISEVERIGDQVINVCNTFENLLREAPLKPLVDLPRMADIAEDMLHRVLKAFVQGSANEALAVIEADDQLDKLNDQIFRELLTYMISDPRNLGRALGLIFAARAYERIGDHAVNIAEDVVYIVRGEDIRHAGKPPQPAEPPAG